MSLFVSCWARMTEDPSGLQVMPRTRTVTGNSTSWRNCSRASGSKIQIVLRWFEPVGVVRQGLGQDLDRDLAAELRIARSIDFAHRARAEQRLDCVDPEPAPNE